MKSPSKTAKIWLPLKNVIKNIFLFLKTGFKHDTPKNTLKKLAHSLLNNLDQLSLSLKNDQQFQMNSQAMLELQRNCQLLHADLPDSDYYTYSILIPVYKPNPSFFRKALLSTLNQSARKMEVIVGFDGPQSDSVYAVVDELQREYKNILKSYSIDRSSGGGISRTTNYLAEKAQGRFLLLMDHDDWIRPDLLYRYEQKLQSIENYPTKENTILYCDEYKINEYDQIIGQSEIRKNNEVPFPYLFINWICHCLLIPKKLWQQMGGCRPECDFAQDYDLVLRLDLAGAQFQNIPHLLYAWRSHSQSTASNPNQKRGVQINTLKGLQNYVDQKKLNWKLEDGHLTTSCRAIPYIADVGAVHVIISVEEDEPSLQKSIEAIKNQKGIARRITLLTHTSMEIPGCETILVNHPGSSFNKNKAVKESRFSKECDVLLFLNAKITLDEHAVLEMCRWIDQPHIGLVGCQLTTPHGRILHQGIEHKPFHSNEALSWRCNELVLGAYLRVVDAIHRDCMLIKKSIFMSVNGFDEIAAPLDHQHLSLSSRLKEQKLHTFFTPYAVGIYQSDVAKGDPSSSLTL